MLVQIFYSCRRTVVRQVVNEGVNSRLQKMKTPLAERRELYNGSKANLEPDSCQNFVNTFYKVQISEDSHGLDEDANHSVFRLSCLRKPTAAPQHHATLSK